MPNKSKHYFLRRHTYDVNRSDLLNSVHAILLPCGLLKVIQYGLEHPGLRRIRIMQEQKSLNLHSFFNIVVCAKRLLLCSIAVSIQ